MSRLTFTIRTSDPVSPNPGQVSLYAKGIYLYYEDSNGVVTQINTANTGTITGAQNLGSGGSDGLFIGISGGDTLDFKSLRAGTNVSFTVSPTEILIDATGGSGEVNTASNIGTGTGIFASKVLFDLQFKSLKNGAGIGITSDLDSVTITSSITQGFTVANTAGTGNSIIKSAVVPTLTLKTLKNGTGISFGITADEITINSDGVLSIANVGSGTGTIWRDTVAGLAALKSLTQGAGINIGNGADTITIASSITQGYTSAVNAGGGISLINSSVVPTLTLKTLAQGTGVTITDVGGLITINSSGTITSVVSTKTGLFQIANPTGPAVGIDSIPLVNEITTALIYGGDLTLNSPTTVNIAIGKGRFTNNTTNPDAPIFIDVTFGPFNNIAVTNVVTGIFTIFTVDQTGTLFQSFDPYDEALYRSRVLVGTAYHPDTTIDTLSNSTYGLVNPSGNILDFAAAVRVINYYGNIYTANGANLSLNKDIGQIFSLGINYKTDRANPNKKTLLALTVAPIRYAYRDGAGGVNIEAVSNFVKPGFYDNGTGTLQTVANNRFTNQRVYVIPGTNQTVMAYGQQLYTSLADAVAGLQTETYVTLPGFDRLLLRTTISLRGTTTNLQNTADATIIQASRFGDVGSGGGSSGGSSGITVDGLPNWVYDTNTTDSLPTTGTFRLNSLTLASASFMYISYNDKDGATLKLALQGMVDDSILYLKGYNSSTKFVVYKTTGQATDTGTYLKMPIAFINTGSSAPANTDNMEFNLLGSVSAAIANVGGALKLETCALPSLASYSTGAGLARYINFRTGKGKFLCTKIRMFFKQNGAGSTNWDVGIYNWTYTGSVARLSHILQSVTHGLDQKADYIDFILPAPVVLSADTPYFGACVGDNGIMAAADFNGRLASAVEIMFQETGSNVLPASTAGGTRTASGSCIWLEFI